MEALFNLDGNVSTLAVYEDYCVLTPKRTFASSLAGRMYYGSKEFYYADLTSVQYKRAEGRCNGHIRFEFPGSNNGTRIGPNVDFENTFIIRYGISDFNECEKAAEYIKSRIAFYKSQRNAPSSVTFSPADELKKYKELLDAGIITFEEFEKKKREILGF